MGSTPRCLVVGGGIAGAVVAYWLGKYDFDVLVIERSAQKKDQGQGIDIEGPAYEVVKLMGILDEIEAKSTGELGFQIVDEKNRPCGTFDVTESVTLTREIEIMRGDLAEVLFKTADLNPDVEFQFETKISSLTQTSEKVIVELESNKNNSTTKSTFDFVIAADGVRSRTRQMAMGLPEQLECYKPVGVSTAFFSLPAIKGDWPRSRLCQFPGRRTVSLRPRGEHSESTSVYLSYVHENDKINKAQDTNDNDLAKEAFNDLFGGLGWNIDRVLDGMMKTDNFYFQKLVQVKLKKWSTGRVVVLGDAAHAPSPLTGKGTALAILGGYVLAQELSKSKGDPLIAFKQYEQRLRKYVEDAQSIPVGGYSPYILCPETSWGIWLFRNVAGFLSWSGLTKYLPDFKSAEFDLEVDQ
jgi:2-polyprenyl-6-methoxyphenol hydroxylase-like FAD-dependent oxidoreductase